MGCLTGRRPDKAVAERINDLVAERGPVNLLAATAALSHARADLTPGRP